jgi:hypothetical protein
MSVTDSKKPAVTEDFLEEDPEITSQKYVLLSFLSPEEILTRKEHFFFEKFLHDYEIQWKTKNLEAFLAKQVAGINKGLEDRSNKLEADGQTDLAEFMRASRVKVDDIIRGFAEYVGQNVREIKTTRIVDDYKDFLFRAQVKLEDEFFAANEFRTSMRGLKVRGVYSTTKEAEMRAKKLQRTDPLHNIFIGEVGKWLPWDPSPHQIAEQEYAEDQLNMLMKKYRENDAAKDEFYRNNNIKRPEKTVFGAGGDAEPGAADGATDVSNQFDGMFGAAGDLAMQRKMATAKDIKIEAIKEETTGTDETA